MEKIPTQGEDLHPGIELTSPELQADSLLLSHWINHIKKQKHHFADKIPYSQSYGFSRSHVWCESWIIKKAEHQRIAVFELWCWRRLLRVPWTARRSNQSIVKKINPEYLLEGLMLKLMLQYFGHLM